MKTALTLSALLLLISSAFSQSKNNISAFYGTGGNTMYHGNIKSDAGFNDGSANSFGLVYTRTVNKSFTFESGLTFSANRMQFQTILPGAANPIQNVSVDLLTIPIIARLNFWRYCFVNGGLLADIETNTPNADARNQSGIGYELGLGVKLSVIKNITVTVNPVLQQHSLIPFTGGYLPYHLLNDGIRFGLGYNF